MHAVPQVPGADFPCRSTPELDKQNHLCRMQDVLEVVVLEVGGVQRRLPLDSALVEASAALRSRDLARCVYKCITF